MGSALGGRSGRWAFEGHSPNVFREQGVKNLRSRLKPGMRVTVSGWQAKDPNVPVFAGHEVTFADGSKMVFGSTPENQDKWGCRPEPCRSHRYPEVPALKQ